MKKMILIACIIAQSCTMLMAADVAPSWWQRALQACSARAGELWSGAQEHKGRIAAAGLGLAALGAAYVAYKKGWLPWQSRMSGEQPTPRPEEQFIRAVNDHNIILALRLLRQFFKDTQLNATTTDFKTKTETITGIFNSALESAARFNEDRLLLDKWVELNFEQVMHDLAPQGIVFSVDLKSDESDTVESLTDKALEQISTRLARLKKEKYIVTPKMYEDAARAAQNIVDERIRTSVIAWFEQLTHTTSPPPNPSSNIVAPSTSSMPQASSSEIARASLLKPWAKDDYYQRLYEIEPKLQKTIINANTHEAQQLINDLYALSLSAASNKEKNAAARVFEQAIILIDTEAGRPERSKTLINMKKVLLERWVSLNLEFIVLTLQNWNIWPSINGEFVPIPSVTIGDKDNLTDVSNNMLAVFSELIMPKSINSEIVADLHKAKKSIVDIRIRNAVELWIRQLQHATFSD